KGEGGRVVAHQPLLLGLVLLQLHEVAPGEQPGTHGEEQQDRPAAVEAEEHAGEARLRGGLPLREELALGGLQLREETSRRIHQVLPLPRPHQRQRVGGATRTRRGHRLLHLGQLGPRHAFQEVHPRHLLPAVGHQGPQAGQLGAHPGPGILERAEVILLQREEVAALAGLRALEGGTDGLDLLQDIEGVPHLGRGLGAVRRQPPGGGNHRDDGEESQDEPCRRLHRKLPHGRGHTCAAALAVNPYPRRRMRLSPTRSVTFSRSKYSESGITNFRLPPTSSLNCWVVISLWPVRWASSRVLRSARTLPWKHSSSLTRTTVFSARGPWRMDTTRSTGSPSIRPSSARVGGARPPAAMAAAALVRAASSSSDRLRPRPLSRTPSPTTSTAARSTSACSTRPRSRGSRSL